MSQMRGIGAALGPSLRAYIENARDESIGGFAVSLPTTRNTLRPILERIEVETWRDMRVSCTFASGSALDNGILSRLLATQSPDALDELNYLAVKMQGLSEWNREVFFAAMESRKYSDGIAGLINIAGNIRSFQLLPDVEVAEYGQAVARSEKQRHAGAMEQLKKSQEPGLRELLPYIRRLEKYFDAEAYARDMFKEDLPRGENGHATGRGYLTEHDSFTRVYRDSADIPAEYRVFSLLHRALDVESAEHLAAVKGVDVSAFLLEMHAVGGEYGQDMGCNLQTLANGESDYFLMMDSQMARMIPAEMLYRKNILENAVWQRIEPTPDIQTYFIAITGREEGRMMGDIYEIDLTMTQNSLREFSIDFTYAETQTRDGTTRILSFDEWNEMDRLERDEVQTYTYRYDPADTARVRALLCGLRASCDAHRQPEPAAAFLSRVNAGYGERAEYPRPEMLRVTLPAAREMLAHGDAPVYRLLPEGPKELSPLDALQSRGGLWYQRYREFAIRREDTGGLEKWAAREWNAAAVDRQPERDTSQKPRSHGLEP